MRLHCSNCLIDAPVQRSLEQVSSICTTGSDLQRALFIAGLTRPSIGLHVKLDLGVDPKKSTGVDLAIPSRVESFMLTATDPQVEFVQTSDLKLFYSQVDLNRLETQNVIQTKLDLSRREATAAFKQFCSVFAKINEA